ncbi:pilus modification protein PilQ [Mergibacter septicus]|uniref:type IV pilus secretin PilQ n=1 Tax=Mergibacter septicus TaxID=221402 RepID=UPI001C78EB72|nr:type IV pilus secretin PilQ [Mergibacter septicus]QDJ12495.1 pilus modification protein PilQ [Mergibacter septicus]
MYYCLSIILIYSFFISFSYATSPKGQLKDPFFTSIIDDANHDNNDALMTSPKLELAVIKLKYANANDLTKALNHLVKSSSYDERTNSVILQAEKNELNQIKQIIEQLDQPITQIAIEARIVTISNDSLDELGVRWGIFEPTQNSHKINGSFEANSFNNLADQLIVNFDNDNKITASLALQVAKLHGRLLDLELRALEQENNVEIIASPHLLTTNHRSASIKQGTELPYLIHNSKNDSYKVEFREAVLGLEVTPHLLHQDTILLDLTVSQNSPGRPILAAQGIVSIDKQEIKSQVASKNGETIVLGGILQNILNKGINKVPVLGDIPLLGKVFQSKSEHHKQRELVIFITPHIIRSNQQRLENYQQYKMKENNYKSEKYK